MTESNWLINSADMEEIIYLYTVESKKAKLVEVVDLSDDNKNTTGNSKNRDLVLSTPNTDQNNNSNRTFDEPEHLFTLTKDSKTDAIPVAKTEVGEVTTGTGRRKRKRREIEVVSCNVCREDYEIICKNGSNLFTSKCGHLFCTDCLRNLETYKCIECNEGIWNLYKVYL
ncbi:hypothetical protein JTE90_014034 [Oedothorax gibbosus]|uniref:RING-type domain-containing protein n=1 Tax=Oedothorax gibbosus TaxID=931172 RepID=A0AAV6V3T3_9ARAC|nr:hypothetical protein JTE90_014034 [Oedothorax gibbosus]